MARHIVPTEVDPDEAEEDDWDEPFIVKRSEPPSTISMKEAVKWLRQYRKMRGRNYLRYRRMPVQGLEFGLAGKFQDYSQIRHELHLRKGFSTRTDPGFLLEQWLAAITLIRDRWPAEAEKSVPRHLVVAVCEALGYSDAP